MIAGINLKGSTSGLVTLLITLQEQSSLRLVKILTGEFICIKVCFLVEASQWNLFIDGCACERSCRLFNTAENRKKYFVISSF